MYCHVHLIPGVGLRKGEMGGIWAEDVEGVGGVEVLPSPDIINHCVWQGEGRRKGGRKR